MLYDSYGVSGVFYILMVLGGILFFFLLLPKRFYTMDFYNSYRESKIKHIVNIVLFFRIVLGLTLATYILYKLFFYNYSYPFLLIGIILVLCIICSLKPSEVIQISTLFGIVCIACYGLYLYNFIHLDFRLLIEDFHWFFSFSVLISFLCMILDNLIYFMSDKDELSLSKSTILLGITLSSLLFLFEYSILTLSSGDVVFQGNDLVGFLALSIEPVSRYNGNFDYIYILIIGVACVFKFSYFLSLIHNSLKWEMSIWKRIFLFLGIFVLGLIGFWQVKQNVIWLRYIVIGLFGLSGILFGWMIKEVYYARKVKE